MTEEQIHLEIVQRVRLTNSSTIFWHTPNAGKVQPQYRRELLALGMLPGVPDLLFFTPPRLGSIPHPERGYPPEISWYVGAALDLKSDTGTLKPEQTDVLEQLADLGWATACTYGLDEALETLRRWGYIR